MTNTNVCAIAHKFMVLLFALTLWAPFIFCNSLPASYSPLQIQSPQDLYPNDLVTVYVDTSNADFFSSPTCFHVREHSQFIPRAISNFSSPTTQVQFYVQGFISANGLDENYSLEWDCMHSALELPLLNLNWVPINAPGVVSFSSVGAGLIARAEPQPALYIEAPMTTANGTAQAQAIVSLPYASNYYRVPFSSSAQTGFTRPNCISVSGSISSNGLTIWSNQISTSQTWNVASEFIVEPALDGFPLALMYSLSQSREGVCNMGTPFTNSLVQNQVLQARNVFAIHSNQWKLRNHLPVLEFNSPAQHSIVSARLGFTPIVFSFSDADENQIFTVHVRARYGSQLSNELEIFSDINLLDPSVCTNSDVNSATLQTCFLDWNSFPVNDKNVVLDITLFDGLDVVTVSSPVFRADNQAPDVNVSVISYPLPELPVLNVQVTDVTDENIHLQFSCDSLHWSTTQDVNSIISDVNISNPRMGCFVEEGDVNLFVSARDGFEFETRVQISIVLDKPPRVQVIPLFISGTDLNYVHLDVNMWDYFPGNVDLNSVRVTWDSNILDFNVLHACSILQWNSICALEILSVLEGLHVLTVDVNAMNGLFVHTVFDVNVVYPLQIISLPLEPTLASAQTVSNPMANNNLGFAFSPGGSIIRGKKDTNGEKLLRDTNLDINTFRQPVAIESLLPTVSTIPACTFSLAGELSLLEPNLTGNVYTPRNELLGLFDFEFDLSNHTGIIHSSEISLLDCSQLDNHRVEFAEIKTLQGLFGLHTLWIERLDEFNSPSDSNALSVNPSLTGWSVLFSSVVSPMIILPIMGIIFVFLTYVAWVHRKRIRKFFRKRKL